LNIFGRHPVHRHIWHTANTLFDNGARLERAKQPSTIRTNTTARGSFIFAEHIVAASPRLVVVIIIVAITSSSARRFASV
jgi:hypothetical protein